MTEQKKYIWGGLKFVITYIQDQKMRENLTEAQSLCFVEYTRSMEGPNGQMCRINFCPQLHHYFGQEKVEAFGNLFQLNKVVLKENRGRHKT